MKKGVLKACNACGADVDGEALVSRDPIHFLQDIDVHTGTVIGTGFHLRGGNIAGKILVVPGATGGTGSCVGLVLLANNKCGPKALLYKETDSIVVQGAILAGIPVMHHFDKDPLKEIKSGDFLRVRPREHLVEVERK